MKKRIVIILFVLIPNIITGQIYQNAFDVLDEQYTDNFLENRNLEEHERARYVMSSYLVMYEATNDVKYLKKLVHWIAYFISNRDDKIGKKDHMGKIGPTWSWDISELVAYQPHGINDNYSSPYGDGLITYPMAGFVQLVLKNKNNLKNVMSDSNSFGYYSEMTFYNIAIDLIKRINETLFNRDHPPIIITTSSHWDNSSGHYRFENTSILKPYCQGKIMPYNQELVTGLTLLYMNIAYDFANDAERKIFQVDKSYYQNKIDALATNFFNDVFPNGIWLYWPLKYRDENGYINFTVEDMSHSVPDITFACEYYKYYPNSFRKAKLISIANNAENLIYKTSLSISRLVNGDGLLLTEGGENIPAVLGAWMPLTVFNNNIYNIVLDIYQSNSYGYLPKKIYEPEKVNVSWGHDLKTVAYLEYYKSTFSAYGFNHDPGSNSNFAGITSGDFNGDNKDEIIAVRNSDAKFLMYNHGPYPDGKIMQYTSFSGFGPNSNWSDIEAGDFDGDGKDEYVASRNSDGLVVILENKYPIVWKKGAYPLANAKWAGIGTGNFSNSPGDEFVILNNDFTDNTKNGFYIYQYNKQTNSIGLLKKSTGWGVNSNWSCVAGGNYDGDSKDEFVVIRNNTNSVASQMFMYELDENNNFKFIRSYTGKTTDVWKDVCSIDIDGDNVDEFIALNETDGNLYLFKSENNTIVLKEKIYFPKKHQIAAISSGNVDNTTPQDELIIVRNFDGDLFVYSSNIKVGSLNKNANSLPIIVENQSMNINNESREAETNSLIDMNYKLYPNPTDGVFHLEFNNMKQRSIQAFNMLGSKVIDITNDKQKIKFDLSSDKGVYLLVINSDGERFVEKLIVK